MAGPAAGIPRKAAKSAVAVGPRWAGLSRTRGRRRNGFGRPHEWGRRRNGFGRPHEWCRPGLRGRLADRAPAGPVDKAPFHAERQDAVRREAAYQTRRAGRLRRPPPPPPSRLPFWPGAWQDLNMLAVFADKARRGRVVAPRACGGRRPRPARFARMPRCGGPPAALLTLAQSALMRRKYPQPPPNRGFKRRFAAELGISSGSRHAVRASGRIGRALLALANKK